MILRLTFMIMRKRKAQLNDHPLGDSQLEKHL
jgi:hypothetical protein